MLSDSIVVIDFETTGRNPAIDRMTEVAAIRIVHGQISDRYESLAYAGVEVPEKITELTGIDTGMLRHAPPVADVMRQLLEFVGELPVAAHYARFDQQVLRSEITRLGLRNRPDDFLCTCRIARCLIPGLRDYRLPTVANHLGVTYGGSAHRAMADAEVTANVLLKLADHVARPGIMSVDVSLLRRAMKCPARRAEKMLDRLAASSRANTRPTRPSRVNSRKVAGHANRPSPSTRSETDSRPQLPPGWRYGGSSPTDGSPGRWRIRIDSSSPPRFVPPLPTLKSLLISEARRATAEWIYLASHRCLIDVVSEKTHCIRAVVNSVTSDVEFTLEGGIVRRIESSKLLRR